MTNLVSSSFLCPQSWHQMLLTGKVLFSIIYFENESLKMITGIILNFCCKKSYIHNGENLVLSIGFKKKSFITLHL